MNVQEGPLIVLIYQTDGPSGTTRTRLAYRTDFHPDVWADIYIDLYNMQGKTFYQTDDPDVWNYTNDTLRRTTFRDVGGLHTVTDIGILQELDAAVGLHLNGLTDIQLPVSILQPTYMFELHLVTY